MTTPQPRTLTAEFLKAATIIFFPATHGESKYIQKRLFALGATWAYRGKNLNGDDDCLSNGIIVKQGTIYTIKDSYDSMGIVCDVRVLSDHVDAPSVAMQRRIDALEKEIAELKATVKPATLAKPVLGGKGAAS